MAPAAPARWHPVRYFPIMKNTSRTDKWIEQHLHPVQCTRSRIQPSALPQRTAAAAHPGLHAGRQYHYFCHRGAPPDGGRAGRVLPLAWRLRTDRRTGWGTSRRRAFRLLSGAVHRIRGHRRRACFGECRHPGIETGAEFSHAFECQRPRHGAEGCPYRHGGHAFQRQSLRHQPGSAACGCTYAFRPFPAKRCAPRHQCGYCRPR